MSGAIMAALSSMPRPMLARRAFPEPADAAAHEACATCGACCLAHGGASLVASCSPSDVECLRAAGHGELVQIGARGAATRAVSPGGACAALEGALGVRVSCAVYDARPGACRVFRPGSRVCDLVRAAAGLPALG